MSDRISLLLDNMVTAVDVGFSYDGIVSMPETGLEDAGHRPGLAGWVDSGVALFQTTIRVMQSAVGVFRKPKPQTNKNPESPVDSGIGPEGKELPLTPEDSPVSQPSQTDKRESDNKDPPPTGGRLPRLRDNRVSKSSPPSGGQRLPGEKVPEVVVSPNVGQTSLVPKAIHPPEVDQILTGKESQSQPDDQGKLPRKSKQMPEVVVSPNVGQTSPVSKAVHPPEVDQILIGKESQSQPDDPSKLPRKKKEELDHLPDIDQEERHPRKAKKVEGVEEFGSTSGAND